jgi:hypothetical protein
VAGSRVVVAASAVLVEPVVGSRVGVAVSVVLASCIVVSFMVMLGWFVVT